MALHQLEAGDGEAVANLLDLAKLGGGDADATTPTNTAPASGVSGSTSTKPPMIGAAVAPGGAASAAAVQPRTHDVVGLVQHRPSLQPTAVHSALKSPPVGTTVPSTEGLRDALETHLSKDTGRSLLPEDVARLIRTAAAGNWGRGSRNDVLARLRRPPTFDKAAEADRYGKIYVEVGRVVRREVAMHFCGGVDIDKWINAGGKRAVVRTELGSGDALQRRMGKVAVTGTPGITDMRYHRFILESQSTGPVRDTITVYHLFRGAGKGRRVNQDSLYTIHADRKIVRKRPKLLVSDHFCSAKQGEQRPHKLAKQPDQTPSPPPPATREVAGCPPPAPVNFCPLPLNVGSLKLPTPWPCEHGQTATAANITLPLPMAVTAPASLLHVSGQIMAAFPYQPGHQMARNNQVVATPSPMTLSMLMGTGMVPATTTTHRVTLPSGNMWSAPHTVQLRPGICLM
jgi:hypothetical protein